MRLVLTAAIVAPGKSDGRPWDGPALAGATTAGLIRGLTTAGRLTLAEGLLGGQALQVVAQVAPWALDTMRSGMVAPDVKATVSVNGVIVVRLPVVPNDFVPTWAAQYSTPIALHDSDQIEIHAVDQDVMFDDEIGVCTAQGMPTVDDHGYAAPDTFRCNGQLWAVAMRVVADQPLPAGT